MIKLTNINKYYRQGDHLPGGAQMIGDGLMGDFEDGCFFQCAFFQQKRGQPLVKALPHDLLHEIGRAHV